LAAWDVEMANLTKERQKLLLDVGDMQSRISRLPLHEQELARVTRDYENTRQNYQSMLDKKLAADVAANMERRQKAERFVMLEMARRPERPIKPKKPVLYGAGAAVSLGLGLVLAIALEFRKGMLLGEWELPPDVLLLGTIPRISAMAPNSGPRWRTWRGRPSNRLLTVRGRGSDLHTPDHIKTPRASSSKQPPRSILFLPLRLLGSRGPSLSL
jgi:hypothetical protein